MDHMEGEKLHRRWWATWSSPIKYFFFSAQSKELQILKSVLQIVTNELQNIDIGPE
jgi:hypothetical protein